MTDNYTPIEQGDASIPLYTDHEHDDSHAHAHEHGSHGWHNHSHSHPGGATPHTHADDLTQHPGHPSQHPDH